VNWKGAGPTPGRANVAGDDYDDADGDGMTDSYEAAQGFNVNDAADAGQDFDEDGKTNEEEFLDGTNPKDANDRWRAPWIVEQPEGATAPIGGEANFSVAAAGTGPLMYQWRANGSAIAGATNETHAIDAVQSADLAEYSVVVWNRDGFVISDGVSLQVLQPLIIVGQPLSRLADRGSTVTFAVFASGTGLLGYQWRYNGLDIPGATGSQLTLTDVQLEDGGNYSVVVTDANGSLASAEATLSVLTPPVITQHPQGQTVVAYNDLFLTVVAGGQGPFTYQWRFNGVNILGATNSVLPLSNVQPNQEGIYRVEVFNPVSSTVSDGALLTVLIPATITRQPEGGMVNPGEDFTFTVAATSSTPIRYQWRFNDADLPGATGPSLSLANIQEENGGNYQVIVTDGIGSVRSDIAVLTVLIAPRVAQAPVSQSAVIGGSVTFSIETRGGLPMGYRWRRSGATLTNFVLNTHKSFLTIHNLTATDAGNYTVVLTNAASFQPGVLSPAGSLTILPDTDGDLMSDAWETGYGFNPQEPGDAGLDFDGDGMTNREEHDAGTDPNDAASFLQLESLRMDDGVTLRFPAASNMTYTVEYTDLLGSGFWRKL
ncbi:MAG TPA: immunoglobulin domain-containing protein, partial [Verrucomicrobiae bacterium]|nr:immunoglobulin domain-containing protein [Verrucomicrobiae bacterium]